MPTEIAIDFETYYDDECTVNELGPWAYVHHPRWHPLLVSVTDGTYRWVGPASECDWERLRGRTLVAHNAAFDRAVLHRLIALGQAPAWLRDAQWWCTAAMSAYLASVRSIHDAALVLLGRAVSKDVRTKLKGYSADRLRASEWYPEVKEYALRDAMTAWELWHQYQDQWPARERALWQLTDQQCTRGVRIDRALLEQYREWVEDALHRIEQQLPWVGSGKEPSSPYALAQACRDAGVPVPPVRSHDEEAYLIWEQTYGERAPWVRLVSHWRQLARAQATLDAIARRLRPDDTIEISLLYFGAHTGRWSGGGGGLNMQNLRKSPIWLDAASNVVDAPTPEERPKLRAIDIRRLFVPREGKKFIIADLAQIEPRVLLWLAGDTQLLGWVAQGMSIYEAYARAALGWRGGCLKLEDPTLYHYAKTQVLGLGYGCGAAKFVQVAAKYGIQLSLEESTRIVNQYRAANPRIVALWWQLEQWLVSSIGQDFVVELPSWRSLTYKRVARETRLKRVASGSVRPRAVTTAEIGLTRAEIYGGSLTENLVQATSRDVFCEFMMNVAAAGGDIVWHVHDELIVETDCLSPEDVVACARTPEWLPGCPIAAEAVEAATYRK